MGGLVDYHSQTDEALFRWINGHHSAALDSLMLALSSRDLGLFLLIAFAIGCIVRAYLLRRWTYALPAWSFLLTMAVAVGTSDLLGARVFKDLTQRLRPCFALADVRTLWAQSNSSALPSLHAANAFAFAVVLMLAAWRVERALVLAVFALALGIGYSRVYNGVHWPTDVLAGFAWGGLCGLLAYGVARRVSPSRP